MEVEDSRSDNDTNTLKQNNEPIISFSPERCRFDSTSSTSTSNFRQASNLFSVADLDVENSSSSSLSHPTSTLSTVSVKNSSIISTTSTIPTIGLDLLTSVKHGGSKDSGILTQQQNSHPFLHDNEVVQLPPSSSIDSSSNSFSGAPLINAYSASTQSSAPTPASILNNASISKPGTSSSAVLPSIGNVDSNSISLMVNGVALSGTNTTTTTTTSSTPSTLELQKRLEKRIAQASAVAAAASTSSLSSSSSTTTSSYQTGGKSTTANNPTVISAKGSENNRKPSASAALATTIPSSENDCENQITFSPQKTGKATQSASVSAFQQKLPASLWESSSSASDIELLWESKLSSSNSKEDTVSKVSNADPSFMDDTLIEKQFDDQLQCGVNDMSLTSGESKSENLFNEMKQADESMAKLGLTSSTTTSNDSTSTANPISSAGENVDAFPDYSSSRITNNNMVISSNLNKSKGKSSSGENDGKMKASVRNNNATSMSSIPPSGANSTTSAVIVVNSGFDIRKVAALLPPQRLAIPCKSNSQQSSHTTASNTKLAYADVPSSDYNNVSSDMTEAAISAASRSGSRSNPTGKTTSMPNSNTVTSSRKSSNSDNSYYSKGGVSDPDVFSGNGNIKSGLNSSKLSSEKKPLVQWDSDESEEELSFFPPAKRGVITDTLSIDNMSLSGEEEDLHLTPPRPLAKRCPCDPRSWLNRREISSSHHHHGHPTRNFFNKPCVIS